MKKYLELFKDGFDDTLEEKLKPENWPYIAYSPSEGVMYTIVPNKDEETYTIYRAINGIDISGLTYKEVDLGEAGVWADRNVGAKSPEHYGSYFLWGTTIPYTYVGELSASELVDLLHLLGEDTITIDEIEDLISSVGIENNDLTPLVNNIPELSREFNINSYFDVMNTTNVNLYYKYNSGYNGITTLESADDAATVHMGDKWKIPTIDELKSLINNTVQTVIDINGNEFSKQELESSPIPMENFRGVKFTAANGNSIFIPTSGAQVENFNSNDLGLFAVLLISSTIGSGGEADDPADVMAIAFGADCNWTID